MSAPALTAPVQGLRIVRLEAQNVKKLRAVEIVPDGPVVQITGANASGKSSVLDAIYWALAGAGAVGSLPVRAGEDRASICLDLGEIVVTRRFTAAGGTSLVVEAGNGARFPSPQKMLDDLFGALTFDPLEFSRMKPKAQLDTLRELVPLDVDVDQISAENRRDYDMRTEKNREHKKLAAQLEALDQAVRTSESIVAGLSPIDVDALLEQMATAAERNNVLAQERRRRFDLAGAIDGARARAAELRRQAETLILEATRLDVGANEREVELAVLPAVPDDVDVADLRQQIETARTTNEAIANHGRLCADRHDLANRVMRADFEAKELTDAIDTRTAARTAAIARAPMPVPGLAFGEGEVLYNGIPFSQASSAEQLRVSIAVAMAANPTLRVLRVKDGSLLDSRGLELLRELAGEHGYQVWIEVVSEDARVGIHLEDGAVAAVNGAPVAAAI